MRRKWTNATPLQCPTIDWLSEQLNIREPVWNTKKPQVSANENKMSILVWEIIKGA